MATELIGQRFGRVVVAAPAPPRRKGRTAYRVSCDCGGSKVVSAIDLKRGKTRSCGCLRVDVTRARSLKHGHTIRGHVHPLFRVWNSMIQRCTNPRDKGWSYYGGRGIRVCARWRDSFEAFLADVGERPAPGLSIDRIENAKGYEPGNVRWATRAQQRANTRPRSRC